MNLRFKTYILILVLSLIVVLIAGMYLELISNVIDYNHPPGIEVSNRTVPVNGGEANISDEPVKVFSSINSDPSSPVSSYPPPQSTDIKMVPYPADPSSAP
jgi:hypothetical protein